MKVFVIPESVEVEFNGQPKPYSFQDFHDEFVWIAQEWRTGSRDAAETLFAVQDKIIGKNPGDEVSLTDAEFEIYLPIATLRGRALHPVLVRQLTRLMRPIMLATAAAAAPPVA